jgi:hypothetical protein
VDEVEKRDLLMVSLEWMTQLWVEYNVAGGEAWENLGKDMGTL